MDTDGGRPTEEAEERLGPELVRLYAILREHAGGLREYELLGVLRGEAPLRGLENLDLFRVHFLLFHHLYRLRAFLEGRGIGTIEIHCLGIRLLPRLRASSNPDHLPLGPDPLADYYLDLENLARMTGEDVDELLRSFWRRFRVYGRRDEALSVLGLGPKASALEIRRRFRELSRTYHPDLGGDAEAFRRVQEAIGILRALDPALSPAAS